MSEDVFEIKDGVLKNYNGTEKKVIIPDGVTEIRCGFNNFVEEITIPSSVTAIGKAAFYNCKNLKEINIPTSVTIIGDYAFTGCLQLKEINIPSSVTFIGEGAFRDCRKLKKANIPSSVTVLSEGIFVVCESLENIDVSPESPVYKMVDGVLYSKDGTVLISYCGGKTEKKFVIPDGVKRIGQAAFAFAEELYEVEIPDGVTEIGAGAFEYCTFLKSVSLPASVKKIEDEAFSNCEFMTSVSLQEGIISIGVFAFMDCKSLREITIPYGVAYMGKDDYDVGGGFKAPGGGVFEGCENLTINCVMDFKPAAWADDWAGDAKVVWGYKGK